MSLPSPFGRAARPRSLSRGVGLGALCALLAALSARPALALPELDATALGPDGLPGGRYVPSARAPGKRVALNGGLGYGYTEAVLRAGDRHQRAELELAAAASVAPWFQLGLRWAGRYDGHSGSERDRGLAAELTLRSLHRLVEEGPLSLALGGELRLPPGSDAARAFRGLSPGVVVVGSLALAASELSLAFGYRAERSAKALADPDALSATGRLASGALEAAVLPIGLAYGHSFGRLRGLVEWSWDLVAGTVYSPLDGPMRVRIAGQLRLGERLLPGLELGLRPVAAPALDGLFRVEPRLWARLTLSVLLERARKAPARSPGSAESQRSELQGTVKAEGGGSVLASVEVLELNETVHTDAGGSFRLDVSPGTYTLRVSAPGFESVARRAAVDAAGVTILVIELVRAP